MKAILPFLLMMACENSPELGKLAVEDCGQPPTAPGIVAYFPGDGTAVLPEDVYVESTLYQKAASTWIHCVSDHP